MLELEGEQKRAEEETRRKQLYDSSAAIFTGTLPATIENWEKAKNGFESLGDYRDAADCAQCCASEIDKLVKTEAAAKKAAAEKAEQERLRKEAEAKAAAEEAERHRIEREKAEAAKKKKKKMRIIAAVIVIVIVITAALIVTKVIIPGNRYNAAVALYEAGQYDEAITAFEEMEDYKDAPFWAKSARAAQEESLNASAYAEAEKLLESGDFEGAIAAFYALGEYKDSATRTKEAQAAQEEAQNAEAYAEAETLLEKGDYDGAIAAYEALGEYKDSSEKIQECSLLLVEENYQKAIATMNNGNYEEAANMFIEILDYSDSNEKYVECVKKIVSSASVGTIVCLGSYEDEPIEWIVLSKERGNALLLSKYILAKKPYEDSGENTTWADSSIRQWLNEDFYAAAFSDVEKAVIHPTSITTPNNSKYNTPGGKGTTDRVFLLSLDEAKKHFAPNGTDDITDDAAAFCTGRHNNAFVRYWLRNPGRYSNYAMCIYDSTTMVGDGLTGEGVKLSYGIRPAIWVEIG